MNEENHDQLILFDQYISKQLDAQAASEFEQSLQADAAFREAFMSFLKSKELIYKSGIREEKAGFEQKKTQLMKQQEQSSLAQQKFQRRRRLMMMAAVLVILLAMIVLLMPSSPSSSAKPEEVFAEYYQAPEIPAFLSIDQDSLLREAYLSFDKKAYQASQSQFEALDKAAFSAADQSEIALFEGIAAIETGAFAKARSLLDQAIQHKQQAEWFRALSWLKEGNVEEAIKAFSQIAGQERHFKQADSEKILDMLD